MSGPRTGAEDDAPLEAEGASIEVAPGVRIPSAEVELRGITGGGPGGQHVNRSATRVSLRWNVRTTRALREEQRARVLQKLASRLDADGTLRIVAGEYRSQLQNRRAAIERLVAIVSRALVVQAPRKPTRPTRGSVERRLTEKRQQSDRKKQRRVDRDD